jgi:rare lipoprotein A (peptidoglycan hydrolase)
VRLPRVVAGLALIVGLALIALPGAAGSRSPSPDLPIDPTLFRTVESQSLRGSVVTTPTLDPANRSDGSLDARSTMVEPPAVRLRPLVVLSPLPRSSVSRASANARTSLIAGSGWHHDGSVSWYGPGFYGHRTACGLALTTSLIGVAHRTLPCGTLVSFRNPANGRTVTLRVVDRGPYVAGRQWDLTGGACLALGHCYTGPMDWRLP